MGNSQVRIVKRWGKVKERVYKKRNPDIHYRCRGTSHREPNLSPGRDDDLVVVRAVGRRGRDRVAVNLDGHDRTGAHAVVEHSLGVETSAGVDEEIPVPVGSEAEAIDFDVVADRRRRVFHTPAARGAIFGSHQQRRRNRTVSDEPTGDVPAGDVLHRDGESAGAAGTRHADLRNVADRDGVGVRIGAVVGRGVARVDVLRRVRSVGGVVGVSVLRGVAGRRGAGRTPGHVARGTVLVGTGVLLAVIAEAVAADERSDDREGTEFDEIGHCLELRSEEGRTDTTRHKPRSRVKEMIPPD